MATTKCVLSFRDQLDSGLEVHRACGDDFSLSKVAKAFPDDQAFIVVATVLDKPIIQARGAITPADLRHVHGQRKERAITSAECGGVAGSNHILRPTAEALLPLRNCAHGYTQKNSNESKTYIDSRHTKNQTNKQSKNSQSFKEDAVCISQKDDSPGCSTKCMVLCVNG